MSRKPRRERRLLGHRAAEEAGREGRQQPSWTLGFGLFI